MTKCVGVVLSGCGFQDGAEIQEAVFTLLALDRAGVDVITMAPDKLQSCVVNHLTGKEEGEPRNVLVESARIARGRVVDIATVKSESLDALVIPGGFGAAKNLSSFASEGPKSTVDPDLSRLVKAMVAEKKPVGAICISPAVVARILGDQGVNLTIGHDQGVAEAIQGCGAVHENCPVEGVIIDENLGVVSTPAYMLGPDPRHVAAGIERLVTEVVRRMP